MFPGEIVEMEDCVVQEGETICRWRYEGVHRGRLGLMPGSGRRVVIPGVDVCHLRDGRISESWVQWDRARVVQQINAVPALIYEPAGGQGDDPQALTSQWAEIHQATGMVSAQLDVGMAIALECLRAHACTADRSLADVAADIVARRLRLADS